MEVLMWFLYVMCASNILQSRLITHEYCMQGNDPGYCSNLHCTYCKRLNIFCNKKSQLQPIVETPQSCCKIWEIRGSVTEEFLFHFIYEPGCFTTNFRKFTNKSSKWSSSQRRWKTKQTKIMWQAVGKVLNVVESCYSTTQR